MPIHFTTCLTITDGQVVSVRFYRGHLSDADELRCLAGYERDLTDGLRVEFHPFILWEDIGGTEGMRAFVYTAKQNGWQNV